MSGIDAIVTDTNAAVDGCGLSGAQCCHVCRATNRQNTVGNTCSPTDIVIIPGLTIAWCGSSFLTARRRVRRVHTNTAMPGLNFNLEEQLAFYGAYHTNKM